MSEGIFSNPAHRSGAIAFNFSSPRQIGAAGTLFGFRRMKCDNLGSIAMAMFIESSNFAIIIVLVSLTKFEIFGPITSS
jgi:hypothetical protein